MNFDMNNGTQMLLWHQF